MKQKQDKFRLAIPYWESPTYEEKEINSRWYHRDSSAKDFFGNQSQAWFPFDASDYCRKIQQLTAALA